MTSRERVLAAINHREPDRMPIDLGMHFSTGISAFAYRNPHGDYEFILPETMKLHLQADGSWAVDRGGRICMPAGGFFFDGAWSGAEDRPADEVMRLTAREAERIYRETEYFTIYMGFGAYFNNHPDWLCRMLTDPDQILEANRKVVRHAMNRAGKVIDAMGGFIQGCVSTTTWDPSRGPSAGHSCGKNCTPLS